MTCCKKAARGSVPPRTTTSELAGLTCLLSAVRSRAIGGTRVPVFLPLVLVLLLGPAISFICRGTPGGGQSEIPVYWGILRGPGLFFSQRPRI